MHNGVDFAASVGTPLYATADGVVVQAGWQSGYGRLIKIQHEFGIETRYAHLSRIRVKVGQRSRAGIALVIWELPDGSLASICTTKYAWAAMP